MQRTDFSPAALQDRDHFIAALLDCGWVPTEVNDEFLAGEDFYLEAQMTAHSDNMQFEASYSREHRQVMLALETDDARLYVALRFVEDVSDIVELIAPLPHTTTPRNLMATLEQLGRALPGRVELGLGNDFELMTSERLAELQQLLI